jgi:hypothetical protein
MVKSAALVTLFALFSCGTAFAQNGPCSSQSSKLACVIPEEYGSTAFDFTNVLFNVGHHPQHFNTGSGDIESRLAPLTRDIGRQANLLPLASPSSGVVFSYDPSLKTFVAGTDSLGPILGERAETVGRHRLFIGFSYQYFDFDKIDGVNLRNVPAVLTHTDDGFNNNSPAGTVAAVGSPNYCSIDSSKGSNIMGCAFIRDRIDTINSITLKVNQYTSYITFGLTRRIDVSVVIPIENVRMSLTSQDTIVPGTNGFITPTPGSPDDSALNRNNPAGHGAPFFFHLFRDCPNTSPSAGVTGLAANCLNHTFPDPTWTGSGSSPNNSASGIGDVVGRVKWNFWEGERAGFAAGLDVRFPSGDALNYLGSGSYGVKPFAVFSYRARISPHVLVGYEWNTDSITTGDLTTGTKSNVPNDFAYSVGADARVTKWLTGDFDIVGQRVFGAETVAIVSQQFLANCGGNSISQTACNSNPTPNTVAVNNLVNNLDSSYNITNASMGIKARPFPNASRLVVTVNLLVRLDHGGLESKPAPLIGLGYTF